VAEVPQLTVDDLQARLGQNGLRVLDVRREGEWQAGHIAEADWWPLDKFKAALPQIDIGTPVAVHCKSGYRSMIACSLLKRAGYENVTNLIGGFDAWLADPRSGALRIDTPLIKCEIAIADIGLEDLAFEAGGIGRRIRVFRLPDENPHQRLLLSRRIPLKKTGDNALHVCLTQEDGHLVWSSPIYVFR